MIFLLASFFVVLCCVVLCSMDRCLFHLPIIRFFIIFIFLIWLFLVKINYYLNLKSVFHFYILLKSWDEIENINFVWIVLYIYMYVFPYYLSISWGGFSKLFPIYIRLYFIYISICNLHVIWCCFYYWKKFLHIFFIIEVTCKQFTYKNHIYRIYYEKDHD